MWIGEPSRNSVKVCVYNMKCSYDKSNHFLFLNQSFAVPSAPTMSWPLCSITWRSRSVRTESARPLPSPSSPRRVHRSRCCRRSWTNTACPSSTCRTASSSPSPSCSSTSERWEKTTSTLSRRCWRTHSWTGEEEDEGFRTVGFLINM